MAHLVSCSEGVLAPDWLPAGVLCILHCYGSLCIFLPPTLLNYLRMPRTGQLAKDGLDFKLLLLLLPPAMLGLQASSSSWLLAVMGVEPGTSCMLDKPPMSSLSISQGTS